MTERMSMEELVAEFEHTRPRHKGSISEAAVIFNRNPKSMAKQLHRARQRGFDVAFIDDSARTRR